MSLLAEVNRQKINLYEQEIKRITNKYMQLLEEHTETKKELSALKSELTFFHREMRTHKYDWEQMFYTANEKGYMYELEKLEERKRSKSL
jgi:hypothetical protein